MAQIRGNFHGCESQAVPCRSTARGARVIIMNARMELLRRHANNLYIGRAVRNFQRLLRDSYQISSPFPLYIGDLKKDLLGNK